VRRPNDAAYRCVSAVLFLRVFVTTFVIMDPIGNVPVFLALTSRGDEATRHSAARNAALTAAAVILSFAAFGGAILDVLNISLPALQVSGGLLLVLVALELLRPSAARAQPGLLPDTNVAFVPLGTPLLAGPGAIAATMVFIRDASDEAGVAIVIGALCCVFVVVYLVLRLAPQIAKLLKPNGVALLSRITGVLLAAIAVQLVAIGAQDWARHGV
jgi:multiple antibiotic resistance protein